MSDAFQIRYNLLVLAREIVEARTHGKGEKYYDVEDIINVATELNKFVSNKNPG